MASGLMRFRQGVRALFAWAQRVDLALAERTLPPTLFPLFLKMRRGERLHSLNVLRTLQEQGYDQPALLTAALLHDVGKSRAPFYLWERVIVVLARAFTPQRAKRWGQTQAPWGWRRPFVISAQHPAWGAEMVADAGADDLVVSLIEAHQRYLTRPPEGHFECLLSALQAADELN